MNGLSLALTLIGIPSTFSKGENCTFLTYGGFEHGVCTFYGACRIKSNDYMYQGGCEELSSWGEKEITKTKIECKIWKSENAEVHQGKCDSNGHCINESVVNNDNPECAAFKMFKSNFTISRTSLYKDQVFKRLKLNDKTV